MRIIPTKIHGILDYFLGIILISGPWILNFDQGGTGTWISIVFGAITLIFSLFTDYELGVWRTFSMRTHLGLDLFSGIFLATSPWIFNFDNYVYVPHLVFGSVEILIVILSQREPADHKTRSAALKITTITTSPSEK